MKTKGKWKSSSPPKKKIISFFRLPQIFTNFWFQPGTKSATQFAKCAAPHSTRATGPHPEVTKHKPLSAKSGLSAAAPAPAPGQRQTRPALNVQPSRLPYTPIPPSSVPPSHHRRIFGLLDHVRRQIDFSTMIYLLGRFRLTFGPQSFIRPSSIHPSNPSKSSRHLHFWPRRIISIDASYDNDPKDGRKKKKRHVSTFFICYCLIYLVLILGERNGHRTVTFAPAI
ncbi:hypothetical protein ACMFMG_009415 [Clarireedia jacksonii]